MFYFIISDRPGAMKNEIILISYWVASTDDYDVISCSLRRRVNFPPLKVSLRPSGSVEVRLMFAGGHVDAVVLCLQVNAVVLCRVVMVTVSSARRRAKMLSPSSASKMQTFDLTWWDRMDSLPLSVTLSLSSCFCLLSFMRRFFLCTHSLSHTLSLIHVSFSVKPAIVNRDSVRDWEFRLGSCCGSWKGLSA